MRYRLKDDLTICQNTYKAAVFNGARIIARQLANGKFEGLSSEESIQLAKTLVSNQLDAVMATIEGDCADKANVLERLEYYMLSNMIN
jgi:hypothetical protein